MKQVLSTVLFVPVFLIYLVIETFLAMASYIYLNLYHPYTFGSLIAFADGLLKTFTSYLQTVAPDLANTAYRTLLGEIGPKSVLLLLIGLIVSALARLIIWAVNRAIFR